MSTRGAIAYRTGDGWEGVYNHSDSYPTGLGRDLWHFIHGNDEGAVPHTAQELADLIKATPQGFSSFDPINRTKRERFAELYAGTPYANSTGVDDGRFDGPHGAYTSVEAQGDSRMKGCYPDPPGWKRDTRHGPTDPNSMAPCGDTTCDPLFMEWVYVVDPDANLMTILATRGVEVEGKGHDSYEHKPGGCSLGTSVIWGCSPTRRGATEYRPHRPSHWIKHHHAERRYRHEVMGQVWFDRPEPDWEALAQKRTAEVAA